MKTLILTDLHRGFNKKTAQIHEAAFNAILSQHKIELVIVSGDLGTSSLKDVANCFKFLRKKFGSIKILVVLGNHDFWDSEIKSLHQKFEKIQNYADEYDIHLLENKPFETDQSIFLGYNGWYGSLEKNTKDALYMKHMFVDNLPMDLYLQKRADEAVNFILDYEKDPNKKVIIVTHFPIVEELFDNPSLSGNPRHGEALLPIADVIIYGHSHLKVYEKIGKTLIINTGSDYNDVQYIIEDL